MADPYGAIIGAAADALTGVMSAVPYLVQTGQDKENAKRIKELKRLRDLGALGLTEEEKQQYFSSLNQAAQGAREDITSKMESATQAFNTGASGRQLALAKAGQEAMGRIGTQIGATVKAQDIAREEAQRQELEDRLALRAERQRQIAGAIGSILMPILGSMSESGALKKTTSIKQAPEGVPTGAPPTAASTAKVKTPEEQDIEDAALSEWGFSYGQ